MVAIKTSSKKYLVIALAILVIILSFTLVYFQYTALQNLRAEVEEEEMAVLAAQTRLNRLVGHRNNAAEYEQRLAFAEKMIPADAGEEEILRYIYRLADEYDLRAVEIRFDNRAEAETYTRMPLIITFEGSYQDLRQMLRHLYNGDRAIRVSDVRISRVGGTGSSLRAVISASAFYNLVN